MEVSRGDEVMALVWFSPVAPGVIECHACADPAWRRRWLTRDVLARLTQIIPHTNMRAAIAQVPTPEIGRIWQRLGFTVYTSVAVLNLQKSF